MVLQMSLADELSRCSLDVSFLPLEHRAHTFVNIYNLLFLFSCIVHKAHPSSMSASDQNDFYSKRHHCLSFEMVWRLLHFTATFLHPSYHHRHRLVSMICCTGCCATTRHEILHHP
jgi:hypothetical protein